VFPDKPVYGSVKELFHNASPEIVSIAVPTAFHDRIFFELIEYPVKAIFCEKPMSLLPETSEEMLREAYRKEILVAVNYTRRWQNSYKNVRQMVKEGKIGTLRAIHAFYPGQIYNIGSHLFDTIRMLGDIEPVLISSVRVNEGPDPSLSGWILCKGDVFISFSATGKREDLIFEIDLVGDTGRIRILQNGSVTEYYRFSESTRYSGYRELVSEPIEEPRDNDRFLDAICDIVAVLDSKRPNVCCSGRDGLIADILIAGALRSAAQEGNPVEIKVD
jgi:predicted dehydrogenase